MWYLSGELYETFEQGYFHFLLNTIARNFNSFFLPRVKQRSVKNLYISYNTYTHTINSINMLIKIIKEKFWP